MTGPARGQWAVFGSLVPLLVALLAIVAYDQRGMGGRTPWMQGRNLFGALVPLSIVVAIGLVRALGHPLTSTSVNPSGQPPARTVEQAKNYFAEAIDLFIDAGKLISRTGSTVVEIRANAINIIRDGEIGKSELQLAVGESEVVR